MTENKLTDKAVRALKPTDKEQTLSDGGALWLRILPNHKGGAVNFYYRFQIGGKERRFNCGSYPSTTLADARKLRNDARKLVKTGIDPVEHERCENAARAAQLATQRMDKTVRELFEDWRHIYLSAHRKDGGAEVAEIFNHDVLPYLGDLKAKDIRLPAVVSIVDRVTMRGARRKANMVLSLLRQMFRHGLGRGIVETDPTLGFTRKQAGGKQTPVERNLSYDEIAELATALPNSGLHVRFQAGIWLLLATGVRVGELTKAAWQEFDMDKHTWIIPAEHSKNGRPHLVHLSSFALKQLRLLSAHSSTEFVLTGRKPESPLGEKTLTKAVRDRVRATSLNKRSGKAGALALAGGEWSLHDLRRTFASRLGDLNVEPHVIERCLNHAQRGIVGVYQRQEYLAQRKVAFDTWGGQLAQLTSRRNASSGSLVEKEMRVTGTCQ